MQKLFNLKTIGINAIPIIIIVVISLIYFLPQLEGKVLEQSDITHFKGMSKELADYRESTGEEAIWTSSMFGGMPGYLISVRYPGNLVKFVQSTFRSIFHPAAMLILYMIGFFILLRSLKVDKWLSLVGAIAFGFSSYFLIIIGAGHNSKAYAIGYMPPMIAGILMAFRGRQIPGVILFTLGLSLNILAGHLQITYYAFLLVAILGIVEFVHAIKEKMFAGYVKNIALLLLGALVALGMNFSRLYTTYEYSKDTIRGPSELSSNNENKTSGLDKDYVVQWSYGIDETMTLLIPNFKGGGSQINPGIDSESYKVLQQRTQNARQNIQAVSMYHGDQPVTSGPVYLGAIVVFLFVLGLFIVKGRFKWWLLISGIISIILSWGGNVSGITNFLLDYLPLYNKFRAPTIILIIVQFVVPLLGFVGLSKILKGEIEKKDFLKWLKLAVIITGGLTLIFAVLPGIAGNFTGPSDAARFPEWLIDSAIADRKNMLRTDAFRSFIFIALAAGLLYAWHIKKLKRHLFVGILGILILADLWMVDKRYLNDNHFESKRRIENPFPETVADKEILKDTDLSYRVLPLQNPFQDARTSYFHKNVGGYHAAKLRRYQELIENHIYPEIQQMVGGLQNRKRIDSVFMELPVLSMLNTRYVIADLNSAPFRNPVPHGNAWFVSDYKIVNNADEEIAAMKGFDSKNTAIIDQRFSEFVNGQSYSKDINGSVELIEYKPNYLKYDFEAGSDQLTVFSEIYYDKGWNAYVDGEKTSHFRVDYVLRAMIVPSGKHTVEFKFEPKSYYTGNAVSMASSVILLLMIVGYVFMETKKKLKKEE